MIISFSTATFDNINGREFLGGPANHGGVILDFLSDILNIEPINFININIKDFQKITCLKHANIIPNFISSSVKFKLVFHNRIRECRLLSKKFSVSKDVISNYKLKELIKNSTIIVSPVINEFDNKFIQELFKCKPKAVFLDLFNNDNGKFSKSQPSIIRNILPIKKKNVFLKLSENEAKGLASLGIDLSKESVITTFGKRGAELRHKRNKKPIFSTGLKVKEINSTGAGNVFVYSFAGLYEYGFTIKKCLNLSNKIAAISTKYGSIQEFQKSLNYNKAKILQRIRRIERD